MRWIWNENEGEMVLDGNGSLNDSVELPLPKQPRSSTA